MARLAVAAFACAFVAATAAPPASAFIYWTNEFGGEIGRANNDGSDVIPDAGRPKVTATAVEYLAGHATITVRAARR